jgi:hypothetical protein
LVKENELFLSELSRKRVTGEQGGILQKLGFTDGNTTGISHNDGEIFDPLFRLELLVLDRSFELAERFEIQEIEH